MKILSIIQKLINLGTHNSNQNEAESAMLKAQQLAIQNNIDIASLIQNGEKDQNNQNKEYVKDGKEMGQRLPICHSFICSILQKHFSVKIVNSGNRAMGRRLYFIGEVDKTEFAKWAYDFLNETFMRLWHNYYNNNNVSLKMRESYIFGLFRGLSDKLQEQKDQMESDLRGQVVAASYAIVLQNEEEALENAMNRFFNNLKNKKAKKRNIYGDIMADGEQDGRKINLSKALS